MIFLLMLAAFAGIGAFCANCIVHALYPKRYCELITESCEEFGVEESLVYAVIHTESGFDCNARSNVGALGLMQIMPETFDWLQTRLPAEEHLEFDALYLPEVNIRYGVYYLSQLRSQFGSDMLAIAAYHAGQGSVSGWLDKSGLPPELFKQTDIPSSATCHYVNKVERAREIYIRLYFSGSESAV